MHIDVFLQARMGSTRLPGKVLKPVLARPLLSYQIERLRESKEIDGIVVLTSTAPADKAVEQFCLDNGIDCLRGSEEDVLDRYYRAALARRPDAIVRVTGDCPIIDPEIVDQVVHFFRKNYPRYDYVSNSMERTYPRGLDVEVFTSKALERAAKEGNSAFEREHVTPFFYQHPELFSLKNIALSPSLAYHRWTVDTPEDFELIRRIIEALYPTNPQFRLKDILDLLQKHPDWSLINAHIPQRQQVDKVD